MRDTWNPWHGCTPVSPGCEHCYMMYLDAQRGVNGRIIHRNKTRMAKPTSKNRQREYKVRPGEILRVCMASDFFLEEADAWRDEAWDQIRRRPDVGFWILTKRPERMDACLPDDWDQGWPNVMLNVTCENQEMANQRMPWLMETPAVHKGVMCAPLIGPVDLSPWLGRRHNRIEQVLCTGENYDGCRPCAYEWVASLSAQCCATDTEFEFAETGTVFVMAGQAYKMPDKNLQREQAYLTGLSYASTRPVAWDLHLPDGSEIPEDDRWQRLFQTHCAHCARKRSCNGCSGCGDCGHCDILKLTADQIGA